MLQDLIKKFNLTDDKQDEALFALTHKKMLNYEEYHGNSDKLAYYYSLGKSVYFLALKDFILRKCDVSKKEITVMANESHSIFLERFIEIHNLMDYVICDETTLIEASREELAYQFLGFLYLQMKYSYISEMFEKIFTIDDLVKNIDYMSLLNEFAKGKTLNFKEITDEITDNSDSLFVMQLEFNGDIVEGKGRNKREARKKCAEIYCKKHQILQSKKSANKKKVNRKYLINYRQEKAIGYIASFLGISFEEAQRACTHISISNMYSNQTNEKIISLGADVEQLYVLEFADKLSVEESVYNGIVKMLHTNKKIYKSLCQRMKISEAEIMVDTNDSNMKESAYADTVKALFYLSFIGNNSEKLKNVVQKEYENYLSDIDLRYIDATTRTQELFQKLEMKVPEYEFSFESINDDYRCAITELRYKYFDNFVGVAASKAEAKNSLNIKILMSYYDIVECIFCGKKGEINTGFAKELIEQCFKGGNQKQCWQMVKQNGYWGYNDFKTGNLQSYVCSLEKIVCSLNDHLETTSVQSVLHHISSFYDKKIFPGTNVICSCLVKQVIEEINRGEKIGDKVEYLLKKAEVESAQRIKQKDSKDIKLLIKLKDMSEEQQLDVVKKELDAYLDINNPSLAVTKYVFSKNKGIVLESNDSMHIRQLLELKRIEMDEMLADFNKYGRAYAILDTQCFDIYFEVICRYFNIQKLSIATGFVFSSGLEMIDKEINALLNNGVKVNLVAGNLQNYFGDGPVNNMDRRTARKLNELVKKGVELRTYEKSFYHGKTYIFETPEFNIIITGSTNVSRNAFRQNRELDCVYFESVKSGNKLLEWFGIFWSMCTKIDELIENRFSDNGDMAVGENDSITPMPLEQVKDNIDNISDELLKKRLLLWLEQKPSNVYDNVMVGQNSYVAFEYKEYRMVVLESFFPRNSYFVFNNTTIQDVLKKIEGRSKTEIFQLSEMEKRGYHVREQLTLELNIKSYFIKW